MKQLAAPLSALLFLTLATMTAAQASNHREAPITALDEKADITDLYAFVSYGTGAASPQHVTLILNVDPLLEPANGPTWFPFDPAILYEIKVDNDHDALADVVFRFRFKGEYQIPSLYTALAGFEDGARDPETGGLVVPPRITSFDDPGLNFRQSYSVEMVRIGGPGEPSSATFLTNPDGSPFFAVPANAGDRTMDYTALFEQAVYELDDGMKVFAGTVDDPFFIDLGAAFDTGNFRTLDSGVPGVLTPQEDATQLIYAPETVSGFAVNTLALEVPIELLTATGQVEPASSPHATLGVWATTSRPRLTVRRVATAPLSVGAYRQVQRIGNPLINELIIGIGSKDTYSMSQPADDEQFAPFFMDPLFPQVVEALYHELAPGALDVPEAPRTDLFPLVTYAAPIAAPGTPAGPIADLLRLNTGVAPTPVGQASRLGLLGGDPAGFPNGRRPFDDVVDVALRVVVGGVLDPDFATFPNDSLGDGVNGNDAPFRTSFPYLADSPSGHGRRHLDPGELSPSGTILPED